MQKIGSLMLSTVLIFLINISYIKNHMHDISARYLQDKKIDIDNETLISDKNNKIVKFQEILNEEERKRLEEIQRQEEERQRLLEMEQIQKNKKVSSNLVLSRGGSSAVRVAFTLSHYGDTAGENGGYAHKTASGVNLFDGVVASNNFPFYTKIFLENYQKTYMVLDTGNKNVLKKLPDGSIKIDIFVPRKSGESNADYKNRIMDLGIRKTYGYVYYQ